jgi:vacuolar-type H+-ATPase subunit I/STV1
MAKVISIAERINKARALIEKARAIPQPAEHGWMDLSYTANVKDTLRQARDLVKFVQFMPNAATETKADVEQLMQEITAAEKEILHKS